jgi:MSHA biogenesis protein MshO
MMIPTQRGFTLVEMVVVIVLAGILSTMGVMFIIQPFEAQQAISRRAMLVDEADTALTLMVRDIRRALPNSVRTLDSDNRSIEIIPSVAGGRYRAQTDDNGVGDTLDFETDDTSFEVLTDLAIDPSQYELVIYNVAPELAYEGKNRTPITGWNTSTSILSFASIQFPHRSPTQRFHIVEQPVSFVCDLTTGTLTRYTEYGFEADPPSDFSDSTSTVLARHVTACDIDYIDGTDTRNSLVRLRLGLSRDGESIELLKQVLVLNTP